MNKENINRLKKYLFLISIFLSFLIGTHILYVYLYHDAIEMPVEGGSISEGIIGEFPHLNPLLNSNDYNKNIIYMLYRGLLQYDFEKKSITSDLAKCDIKNLKYIECYLENNITWSHGKEISTDDIIATYNLLKNSEINPIMSSLLKDTQISNKQGVIIFSNTTADVNFLQVLLQPIVAKEILDNIGNKELFGKFNPMDGVYSGPYKVDTVSYDDSLGIQKLILTKNNEYKTQNILISKYIYKIFRDTDHFLKHKDILNIFGDKNNLISENISRLEKTSYFLHQYTSIFLNEESIKNIDLRDFLLSKIDSKNIITSLGSHYKEVPNLFLIENHSGNTIEKTMNLENTMKEIGYYKKDYLAENLLKEAKKNEEKTTPKNNQDITFLTGVINKKYNFTLKDDIQIRGYTQDNTIEAIYINDYKLTSFKKGESEFLYKLKKEFKNISPGENTYKIFFEKGGKKELKEEIIVVYSQDSEKLKNLEIKYFPPITQGDTENTVGNIDEERKAKILALNDKYYYNSQLNKLSFKLYYIDSKQDFIGVANIIKNTLESYGIAIDTIPISLADLNKKITSGEKDYDMILVGIDLGVIDYDMYPYFHSGQAKNGFNFSNIKNLTLDILLEELKTKTFSKEEREKKQVQIINIIEERKILKPLYQKRSNVFIDKNIKRFSLQKHIPLDTGISHALLKSYVTGEKEIIFEKKGFYNFIDFILNIFK